MKPTQMASNCQGSMGCDTTVTIALLFQPLQSSSIHYLGCEGDRYEVLVNGTIYDATNPQGTEVLTAQNGCDSIITISLDFLAGTQQTIDYAGCAGDNYSILVNGTLYNENNPTGIESLTGSNGCDSIVTINLAFDNQIAISETYSGCEGDGYSILVNGNLYDELHPLGNEIISGVSGCDTLVDIELTFAPASLSTITYAGCSGDGYVIEINETNYNEQNPNGVETLTTINGCDSIINVNLSFANTASTDITYTGCSGDGYAVNVNGSTYNESNPSGLEMVQTTSGCDSIIQIALTYEDCDEEALDCVVYIPNAISPNDDGINDEFSFGYSASCEVVRFSVALFDRWGQALYASDEPLFKWKGDFSDKILAPGVYVFVAEIHFADTSTPLIRRGDVTIIR
jgi:gliding motility-associated-like protein